MKNVYWRIFLKGGGLGKMAIEDTKKMLSMFDFGMMLSLEQIVVPSFT